MDDIPQPGSLEAEAGVFCSTFDMTGSRLITGCADKTIKVRVHPVFLPVLPLTTQCPRFMLNKISFISIDASFVYHHL